MTARGQPESTLVDAVIRYCWERGCYVWRNNTGAYKPPGSDRFIRYGTKGSADVLGIAGDGTGRLLAIECKTDAGRLGEAQRAFLEKIRERGGIALVVRPEDWSDVLEQALGRAP